MATPHTRIVTQNRIDLMIYAEDAAVVMTHTAAGSKRKLVLTPVEAIAVARALSRHMVLSQKPKGEVKK